MKTVSFSIKNNPIRSPFPIKELNAIENTKVTSESIGLFEEKITIELAMQNEEDVIQTIFALGRLVSTYESLNA